MAKCPACRSKRVYKGYRPAPLLLRLIRIHDFLCENCNLQFRAFSILPPRSRSRKGKNSKHHSHHQQESQTQTHQHQAPSSMPKMEAQAPINLGESNSVPQTRRKPLMAKATSAAASSVSQTLPPKKPMTSQNDPPKSEPPPTIKAQWEMPADVLEELQTKRHAHRSHQVCPSCGATDTERRRRKMWEKAAFAFTNIRAYQCRICGADFYARRKPKADK